MNGTVYLVGAGPGAVDLLTLRAARLLEEADVVLHDALVSDEVLALAQKAQLVNVGKRAGRPSVDQRLICRLLVRKALRYRIVVRLKGGDPHLFARATEELEACRQAGINVVTVPGVSAAFAAASTLNASLTAKGVSRSVAFVTPSSRGDSADNEYWADAAGAAETSVLYMGAMRAETVRSALLARGKNGNTAVAFVESATCAGERVVRGVLADLPKLAQQLGDGPAILLVGDAIAVAEQGAPEILQGMNAA